MSFLQRCAVRFGRTAQQKPLVSLCVPVYGTERLVERFLDSVLAQKDAPLFETIVVNDGSPDTVYNLSITLSYIPETVLHCPFFHCINTKGIIY